VTTVWNRINRIDKWKILVLSVMAVALLLRLVWTLKYSPTELSADPYYYDQTATGIVLGEGYHNGSLAAYRPPGYPYFLAAIYHIFGHDHLAVKIIQVLLSMVSCFLAYALVKRVLDRSAAALSACVMALYPQFVRYPGELWSETLFICLFLCALLFLFRFRHSTSLRDGVASGVLLGLTALVREVALYFIVPVALWLYLSTRGPGRAATAIRRIGVVVAAMVLTVCPWTIRNYVVFGKLVPISTNGGVNFFMGNNAGATGEFGWAVPRGTVWPNSPEGQTALATRTPREVHALELEIQRKGYRQGLEFIWSNPTRTAAMWLKKLAVMWRPPYYSIDVKDLSAKTAFRLVWLVFYSTLLLAAIPGMVLALKEDGRKWCLLHLWLAQITAIHIATYSGTRYRLPMIPVFAVFAALTVHAIRRGSARRSSAEVTRVQRDARPDS
jgi:4-amino-4-deoxy-L-arabinose transferase-like glycosyltransferase